MGEPVRRYNDFEKRLAAATASRPKRPAVSPLRVRVGHAVQDRRRTLGITQAELAGLLGVSQPSVSAWEVGNALPSSEVLLRIASVLGLNLGELADPPKESAIPARSDQDRPE